MKIIFPHIPKCAGSSIKSQLAKREDVFLDYFNHPTWAYEPDKESGRKGRDALKNTIRKLDSWIVFGHFPACIYYDLPYDLQIILLRDPLERAASHYHYIKQIIPDNNITRRRHAEVGPIKESRMSIEDFVELDHIKYFYSKYYLNSIALDERLIVVPMDDMESSCSKIMEVTNIKLDHTVRTNKGTYIRNFDHMRNIFHVDTDLYKCLISRPNRPSDINEQKPLV